MLWWQGEAHPEGAHAWHRTCEMLRHTLAYLQLLIIEQLHCFVVQERVDSLPCRHVVQLVDFLPYLQGTV